MCDLKDPKDIKDNKDKDVNDCNESGMDQAAGFVLNVVVLEIVL